MSRDWQSLNWEQRRSVLRARQLREDAASRKAAGGHITQGRVDPEEIMIRLAERPEDTRDLTGVVFGDPIPGDTRRTWAPHLAGGR